MAVAPSRGGKVTGALKSLAAVAMPAGTATATGTAYNLGGAYASFAVQTTLVATTSATAKLMGSIDGTNYKQLGADITLDSTLANQIVRSTNSTPVNWVRLDITARTTKAGSTVGETITGFISVS